MIYAVGKIGEAPRLSQNPAFLNQADDEHVVELSGWPDGEVVIGEDGESIVPAPIPLERLKATRWLQARMYRDDRADSRCATPLGVVDCDPDSRAKINGAVSGAIVSAQLGQPFTVDWTMSDNSIKSHDGPAMLKMGMAVLAHVSACQTAGTAIRAAIDAAADADALQVIDITEGYPTAS